MPNTLNLASWRVDPYLIDSITVLRGPTSVLYGQGDPGAIVDVQSKLANGERTREIEAQVGNYARKQLSFGIGGALYDNGTLSYRLLGVGRDGNAAIAIADAMPALACLLYTSPFRPSQSQ